MCACVCALEEDESLHKYEIIHTTVHISGLAYTLRLT